MSDRYADWDAAYVLGALSRDERLEYEDHVDGCARCAAAVAELGMMPGLLRLAPAPVVEPSADEPAEAPAPPRSTTLRRRWALAGLAAGVVLAVGVGVPLLRHAPDAPGGHTVTLAALTDAPLAATVTLTPHAWGTEVAMTCAYTGEYGARRPYALYVVDTAGHRQLVSRWRSGPGDTAHTSGATDLPVADIARVELRRAGGPVLLADDVQS
ncbi:anti-sigma factor family protein [Nocardioides montaniterrae]